MNVLIYEIKLIEILEWIFNLSAIYNIVFTLYNIVCIHEYLYVYFTSILKFFSSVWNTFKCLHLNNSIKVKNSIIICRTLQISTMTYILVNFSRLFIIIILILTNIFVKNMYLYKYISIFNVKLCLEILSKLNYSILKH